jgi:hypothetical protein
MLSTQGFIILIAFYDLGNVVDIMSRGVGIPLKSMKLFVLRNLSYKLLQIRPRFILLSATLILSLLLSFPPNFKQFLFFFSFFLHMLLHISNFRFDKIQLLVKLHVFLAFLFLQPPLLC